LLHGRSARRLDHKTIERREDLPGKGLGSLGSEHNVDLEEAPVLSEEDHVRLATHTLKGTLQLPECEVVRTSREVLRIAVGAPYDVFTFFVTCHHLVDWVVSDATLPRSTQRKARALVSKSNELKMCADLANRSKHCALTRTRTGDSSTGPSGNDATVMMGRGAKHAFRISSGGTMWDALDLARACVRTWRTFFAARGL
jgi:hypothetical protein